MIWIIGFALAGLVWSIRGFRDLPKPNPFFETVIYGIVSAALMGCAGFVLAIVVGLFLPKETVCTEIFQPVGLQEMESGKLFFIGVKKDRDKISYAFYFKKTDDQDFRFEKIIYANNMEFHQAEGKEALIKIYRREFAESYHSWFGWMYSYNKYVFYIPQGTLKNSFIFE